MPVFSRFTFQSIPVLSELLGKSSAGFSASVNHAAPFFAIMQHLTIEKQVGAEKGVMGPE